MAINNNVEKGHELQGSPDTRPQVVLQPGPRVEQLVQLSGLVDEITQLNESTAEDRSGDWSGSSGKSNRQMVAAGDQKGISPREKAIAALPSPPIMQQQLEQHIRGEVKRLRKEAQRIARLSHPGAAYHLNQLYSRIRKLNAMIAELFEASYEVVRRLFIKVFIDRQPIL